MKRQMLRIYWVVKDDEVPVLELKKADDREEERAT